MIAYLVLGATYAFAAAVQPGPLLAYLASRAVADGWRRTVPAALAPVLSDGPIIVLVLTVLSHVPDRLMVALRCGGGLFLLYLSVTAFQAWRRYDETIGNDSGSPRRSLLGATIVNLLNPGPYLGWSLVLGPLLLKGWRETPANGAALVVGFYATMVISLAGIILLFAKARRLGPRVGRALVGVSVVALACFGCYQLWMGIKGLLSA
jgi:threonine/homoserine/homoserine lactone efflux protein